MMLSLFRFLPSWVYGLFPVFLELALTFGSGYLYGRHQANQANHLAEVGKMVESSESAREQERLINRNLSSIAEKHHKKFTDAKSQTDRLLADVRSGAMRLSVSASDKTGSDTAIASGDSRETRTELDAATAEALIGIAAEADSAIRQLNACIDAYGATDSFR